ncbi:putative ammonia transport-related membrane protein [Pseudomonas mandelii JR-1]|uniref:Putative ammonia transport-related membrane protein n=1 Tax=Pseudomonas mandelii JR-1 TaxID=1147786 RepID=A0A024E8D0_9PSED|nr:putative ammonia transport-related membrane protein [Pseudomonas mandelii JR-1]
MADLKAKRHQSGSRREFVHQVAARRIKALIPLNRFGAQG